MVTRFIRPAQMARQKASFVPGSRVLNRELDQLGSHTALDDFAASNSIALDGSDLSISALDARLGELPDGRASELLKDIAVYLGDVLAQREPTFRWSLDAADYPRLRMAKTEVWDVIEFVHWRQEGRPTTLLAGVEEMVRRRGTVD